MHKSSGREQACWSDRSIACMGGIAEYTLVADCIFCNLQSATIEYILQYVIENKSFIY